ncbi:MAG: single-stranded-DNA-specific exonuclease RecJ [Hyphomicrobiales bacterium]|nr:single-stranded-DNA-specific exonuclease RecJ [Hyphomicrobiales bacterium]MCP5372832.1 single-stranded-DNA-specific exonuclease RecJ [Hyphomicrobiales bacterium]
MRASSTAREPADAGGAFLDVERSLGGRRWTLRPADDRTALAMAQRLGLPEVVGRVLCARGVGLEQADSFLDPTLRDLLPDPSAFRDMDLAAERLAGAIMQGEQVCVFGDYDVDGATSSALVRRFVEAAGGRCRIYIPDRLSEGYGPNAPALARLAAEGASVVVTVDCGTAAHDPLAAARDAGLDVIVVDHHEAESRLPPALAVVNPNRLDENLPYGNLAAVGVAFLLAVAVNRHLRRVGWYASRREPDLLQWLDLVALGTVCDVVPLHGVNRALVAQGLRVMALRRNPGLRALADVARLTEPPGTYHAGFVLGPRINAGGRVGAADLGARLLTTEDPDEAADLAARLDRLNAERQEIEARVLHAATAAAEAQLANRPDLPLVLVANAGWHPGVIGIVASRLKDLFDRPACVVGLDPETGQGTGSGRSVPGVDLGAAIIAARQAGHLVKGGGHAMAAGFTVEAARLDALRGHLVDRLSAAVAARPEVPGLSLDGALKVGGANRELFDLLARVGPYGQGNPEPRFVLPAVRVEGADLVGRDRSHLRCRLRGDDGRAIAAMAFRAGGSDLGAALLRTSGAPYHVAGKVRLNTWQGRTSLQFLIDDAAPVW